MVKPDGDSSGGIKRVSMLTVKFLNFWRPETVAVILLKIQTKRPYNRVMCQKDADGVANREDPLGAV